MDTIDIKRKELEHIYGKVSPFELKNALISLAEESKEKGARSLLDAGRGNPNWTAATPREAFFTFGLFSALETRRVWNNNDLAGMPEKLGIAERFDSFIKENSSYPGAQLLKNIIDYGIISKGLAIISMLWNF